MTSSTEQAEAAGPPQRLRTQAWLEAWSVTGVLAAAGALLVLTILAWTGLDEAGLSAVIRHTARLSASVFLLAFIARPLHQIWRSPFSAWALRNRRYVGVGFAAIHFGHLAAIATRGFVYHGGVMAEMSNAQVYGGGFIYLHIVSMTVTSSDRAVAWLGRSMWKFIHVWGIFGIWIAFVSAYGGRVVEGDLFFAPILSGLIAGLLLRVYARFSTRR